MPVKLKFWDERTATKFAGFVPKKGIDGFLGITIDLKEHIGNKIAPLQIPDNIHVFLGLLLFSVSL